MTVATGKNLDAIPKKVGTYTSPANKQLYCCSVLFNYVVAVKAVSRHFDKISWFLGHLCLNYIGHWHFLCVSCRFSVDIWCSLTWAELIRHTFCNTSFDMRSLEVLKNKILQQLSGFLCSLKTLFSLPLLSDSELLLGLFPGEVWPDSVCLPFELWLHPARGLPQSQQLIPSWQHHGHVCSHTHLQVGSSLTIPCQWNVWISNIKYVQITILISQ